ncbi:glycosyltransferase family 4 protein [Indioceanicola profundi]|uniref:glycosyltransferase family 4 protein n=1 Tax=Indioceanicola profundi TaxID=2220096 RepID=UPI000E6AA357|nr:glycosyltransferase family 4 protein [Indioceanicola profundi]
MIQSSLSGEKPRLLFLSPVFPYPLDRGQHVRIANLIQGCSRDFAVTLVSPPPPSDAAQASLSSFCEEMIAVETGEGESTSLVDTLRNFVRTGEIVGPERLPLLHRFARALEGIQLDSYDLIWVERRELAPLLRAWSGKTILDLDDVEHKKHFRELREKASPRQSIRMLPRGLRLWYRETMGARRYLATVVCSDEDRDYLKMFGMGNVHTVPNGVAMPTLRPRRSGRNGAAPRLVFVGNMQYGPNLDAVEFFAREIHPLLSDRLPGLMLDVIGPGTTQAMREAYAGPVRFRGFVDDLADALAGYDVFVAPLRLGGGTKLKVLEAMANRIPLSTTPVGAEGLALRDRTSALISDTPHAIAEDIFTLCTDKALADRLAENAFQLTSERFRWDRIRGRAADWLRELAAAH